MYRYYPLIVCTLTLLLFAFAKCANEAEEDSFSAVFSLTLFTICLFADVAFILIPLSN